MLKVRRFLPHTFKPVNNLICCMSGWMWVVKRATSLFNSLYSNVARQVARFLLPVFPFLKVMLDETIRNDDFSATQRCNIVAKLFRIVTTLFQHYNAVLG